MTAYSVLHLVLAAVCAAMALVHFALWIVVRADRVQIWVAASFVGFAAVTLAIAGSGIASEGSLGPARPWIVLGTLSIPFLWIGPLLTAWNMVGHEVGRSRRALLVIALALGLARMLDVASFIARSEPTTWEAAFNSLATPTVMPAWLMTLLVGATCIAEAARDLGRRSPAAWVLLLTATPATLLVVREVNITLGLADGPTWLALTGLPFLFTASAIVALRYAQAMRGVMKNVELSGYKLVRRIDAGGMGELYVATRTGPGGFERICAVKKMLLDEESEEMVERFLGEARLAAQLDHPNIVAVNDVGKLGDGGWFIAMEYLPGVTLSQLQERLRFRRTAVPIPFVVRVGEQVCRGLSFAHSKSVVHRDVSPQNVMVTFRGDVKVIDFGIAVEKGKRGVTGAGLVIGKGPYMSPERIAGLPAEPASDIFALGVTLYELLVGFRPFSGKSPTELSRAIQTGQYASMRDLRPEIPEALEKVIDRALAARPADRWPSGDDFGDALAEVQKVLAPVDLGMWIRDIANDVIQSQRRADVFAGVVDEPTRRVSVRLT